MPQPPDPPPNQHIPLVVDLDGTLIKTDLLWESLARLLRRNPFSIFQILLWWARGRAFLKKKLAARVKIAPTTLPYNEKFLEWLREQKAAGRKIILATASDLQMAKPVADYVGLFDEVLASDGKMNLRSGNKLKLLVEKFGARGFDYAGNSSADFAVWQGAREAIVVNASSAVSNHAAQIARVGATFPENYSPLFIAKRFLDELFIRSGYLAAIVAGLLLTMAFPKFGIAGFAWIAPALLAFAACGKNSGDAFRIGYIAGLAHFLTSLYWLLLIPYRWHSLPLGPALGWISLGAFLALFPATWTWINGFLNEWILGKRQQTPNPPIQSSINPTWGQRLLLSLLGAAVWVALEMIRSRIFGGFPWNFVGASQFKMVPLIQIASVTGVYGVSFLVVWVSLSLFSAAKMILQKPASRFAWQSEFILPFVAVAGIFMSGEIKLGRQNPATSTLRVTLIQPSIPQTTIWDEKENAIRFHQLLELSQKALNKTNHEPLTRPSDTLSPSDGERDGVRGATPQTDLLIWPESAVPEFSDANYTAITNLVQSHHVWLIFNADDIVPRPGATNEFQNDDFNSAFLFAPERNFAAVYHKQKLVIFGEYIPLARWLPFLKWFTPIRDSYAAGTSPAQFDLGAARASPLICYEDMFPQVARKTASWHDNDFLVNLTNDGWFGNSAEQWQHLAGGVFRAVENGIPLVRCCNNGVTCWIDANGRVRETFRDASGSVYGMGAMTIDLPLQPHAPTFYNLHGDWFGWGCVGILLILLSRKLARSFFL